MSALTATQPFRLPTDENATLIWKSNCLKDSAAETRSMTILNAQIAELSLAGQGDSHSNGECLYDVPKSFYEQPQNTATVVEPKKMTVRDPILASLERQPWYHGQISRVRSEKALTNRGDFLVRASISQKGEYVLTSHNGDRALHFQINRTVISPSASASPCSTPRRHSAISMFHFEEEQFDSIVDLIEFYRSHRKPITEQSKLIIDRAIPVDSTSPRSSALAEIEASYAAVNSQMSPTRQFFASPTNKPAAPTRPLPKLPTLPNTSAPSRSPLERRVLLCQANKHKQQVLQRKYGSETHLNASLLAAEENQEGAYAVPNGFPMYRSTVALHKSPPTPLPKPAHLQRRTSSSAFDATSPTTTMCMRRQSGEEQQLNEEQNDYCDIDYAEMDCFEDNHPACSSAANNPSSLPPPLPERPVERDSACVPDMAVYDRIGGNDTPVNKNGIRHRTLDKPLLASRLRTAAYRAIVKHADAPLNTVAIRNLSDELLALDVSSFAGCVTRVDCWLCRACDARQFAAVFTNEGGNARRDVHERAAAIHTAVRATIVCASSQQFRSRLLTFWIGCAASLIEEYRNEYGFVNVMRGLTDAQVQQHLLRAHQSGQLIPSVYVTYEKRLRPRYHGLVQGISTDNDDDPSSSKTALPHILPLLQMLDGANNTIATALQNCSKDVDTLVAKLHRCKSLLQRPPKGCSQSHTIDIDSKLDNSWSEDGKYPFLTECLQWGLYGRHTLVLPLTQRLSLCDQLLNSYSECSDL